MSEYIVSARKYRPDSFETLIGQDNIARTLSNSIKRGQLAHAYLFCGPRGVGKTTTARIFAKMINCSHPGPDMEPCGECESCVSFQEGRSYCIHELDAASNNSVEDIKTLMEQVQVPPQVGRYSVYIIDEVHMLSQAAFNAFLKTLEEPPAHAIFILATTEKHKILPTILSRCQTYDFNRISIPDMVRNLRAIATKEGIAIDDESLHVIASKADGAMRDALTIFDQTVAFCGTEVKYDDVIRNLNVLDYEYSFSLVDHFLAGEYGPAFLIFDEILVKGFNALHFVGSLSSHLRNLVVARTGGLEPLLELPDSLKKRYAEQASRCSVQFLFDALGITTACETGYKAAVNPRLHIEYALMRLSKLTAAPAAASVPVTASAPVTTSAPVMADDRPSPAPRRRAAKTGSALSMNALMDEKKEEMPVEAPQEAAQLPSDETVLEKWKELARLYESRPRLASTLSSGKVEVSEADGVKIVDFSVRNEAQKQWIEEKLLRDMEGKLRDLLSSSKVNILIKVVQEEGNAEKVPYMPEDKAKDLMDKNPDVRAFIADMGLDTK
ncbi:MAG: DNA polymerase III subunit gamma/tau [Bacteroidales bacterium]|nr:DNA polymerase III subunit gamma/tau [Bacteroidales bacterium]